MLSLEEVEYERPYPMAQVDERTEVCCSRCGLNSKPRPAEEITVILHRHASHKNGQWMCYCHEHLPKTEWVEGGGSQAGARGIGPTCPRCWVAVPPVSRWCDNCDRSIDE